MKTIAICLFIVCSITAVSINAQNAPVTTAGIITNATTVPGSVIVPVTVRNFVSIGSFTLTLRYRANLVTFVNAAPHASFPGMTVVNSVAGTLGKIVITWPQTPGGVTLPDDTHLLDLTFTYISGSASLTWLYTGSYVCQYAKYAGGLYVPLTDTPKSAYYVNGAISNRGAPVTTVPFINNPVPGNLAIPITVNNFSAIGAMSLTLEFNQAVLNFQNCVPNPALLGTFNAGTQVGPNGKMLLTISWFGLASLSEGSTVVTANFIYSNTNGSYSSLNWYETGSSCEYADAMANVLPDSPTADYYKNGAVYSQEAPKVWLPVNTNVFPQSGLNLPVLVSNFNNIRSFSLTFEYDPAVMGYNNFIPDPAFGSALTVTDSPSGSKRKIVMSWTGTENKILPDGSQIARLNFIFYSGTSPLAWIVSDGTSCRFNDSNGNTTFDLPKSSFYKDGLVSSHRAPLTAAANVAATPGQLVTVPLKVFHFSNIGLFSFTLDYDPAVLTWLGASLVPPIGGAFTSSAAGLGRIVMNWSGPAASLADGSSLVNLIFTYNGGASPLAWFDDGNSCRYAESVAETSLYDLPTTSYYINGYVGPNPLAANFTASPTTGGSAVTVVLTDQTTGGPTAWSWKLSPSTWYFVNGTTASSQNPQVRFTSDGVYSVTLVATRGTSASIIVKNDYLSVGTLGYWTGITSSDWFTGSNWQNSQVPPSSAMVFIPSSAPNWPHLTGGLSVGTLCKNISIEGAAKLYVDGDLTINAGSSLAFKGDGTLYLGGSWLNGGVFDMGASTVEFTGPNNATIFGGAFSETFWKIIFAKTNATVFVQGYINVMN